MSEKPLDELINRDDIEWARDHLKKNNAGPNFIDGYVSGMYEAARIILWKSRGVDIHNIDEVLKWIEENENG